MYKTHKDRCQGRIEVGEVEHVEVQKYTHATEELEKKKDEKRKKRDPKTKSSRLDF